MPAIAPGEERIYSISPVRKWIVIGTWLFVVGVISIPFAAMALARHNWPLATIIFLLAAGLLAFFIEISGITRLVLTAKGMETRGLHGRKAGLFTPWENVAAIRLTPKGAEGLVLKEPLEGRAAERLTQFRNMAYQGTPLYDAEKRLLLGEKRYFPLEVFAHWIRHGDLWDQIREHAPWLADAQGQAVDYTPRIPVEPWTTRKTVFVVGLIAFSIALGLLFFVLPPRGQEIFASAMSGIIGGSLALFGVSNLWSSMVHLRQKHFLEGGLWLAMGIIQVLFALTVFMEIVRPTW